MSHAMNILERLDKVRLKREVTISEQQYGFMLRKNTADVMLALRELMEKHRKRSKRATLRLN